MEIFLNMQELSIHGQSYFIYLQAFWKQIIIEKKISIMQIKKKRITVLHQRRCFLFPNQGSSPRGLKGKKKTPAKSLSGGPSNPATGKGNWVPGKLSLWFGEQKMLPSTLKLQESLITY